MACDAKCQEEAAKRREVGTWTLPEHAAVLARLRPTMGHATTDDLLAFARIELNDALDNVDPIEGGSAFHAGCCMMRAEAAIYTVQKRLRDAAAASIAASIALATPSGEVPPAAPVSPAK
jgi:hypothetical protein